MEIDGHPTQDMVDELQRRGAQRADGTSAGPNIEAVRFINEQFADAAGYWLFVPVQTYMTGMDEIPG